MIRVNLVKSEKKDVEKRPASSPDEPQEKKKRPPLSNLLIALAIVVVGALALIQKRALDTERALLADAQSEKARLQPVVAKLDLLEQQKTFLVKKIGLITILKARQAGAVRIMEEISRDLPDWVWLTEVNLRGQGLELKGRALSNIQISDFMRNLEKSGLFDAVGLGGSTQRTQGTNAYLEFVVSAALAAPAGAPGAAAKPAGAK
jgi:type IV pilus assembly protein PilN